MFAQDFSGFSARMGYELPQHAQGHSYGQPGGAQSTGLEWMTKDYPGSKEVKTGTSIMAVKYGTGLDSGVVIGADTRTSSGSYVANRVTDKLDQVTSHIFVQRSGSSADTQAIADIVRYYISMHTAETGEMPAVQTAANLLKDLIYSNKDRLMAGMICAGWDPVEGASVYEVTPFSGTIVQEEWSIGGSGSSFIYGYCDAEYKPGMTKEEAKVFVTTALAHAMSRDGSSGGCIRIATIDKDGAKREFVQGDKLPYN